VLGLLRAKAGKVRVFGLNPVTRPVEVLSRIGYVSEDRDLPPWMSVVQLLRYTPAYYPTWDAAYAETLLSQFHLSRSAIIRTLSKGELAKAGLLVALAHRPDLLVLDEPSSGLDPIVRRELLEVIVRSVVGEGRTVLFSSHLLDEIARISDCVAMVVHGRLVLDGSLQAILERHQRLVVRMPKPFSSTELPPGALSMSGGPTEWTFICSRSNDDFLRALRYAHGEVLEESEATFEEIFHARAGEIETSELESMAA
jgi:ABC-2 type transport system ATP-binding protein